MNVKKVLIVFVIGLFFGSSMAYFSMTKFPGIISAAPAECEAGNFIKYNDGGDINEIAYTQPDGFIIDYLCILSGERVDDEVNTSHTGGIQENGDYEGGCFNVAGVGTSSVSVTREGDDCPRLIHLDINYIEVNSSPTPTPSPSPSDEPQETPTPTPTATPSPSDNPASSDGGGDGGDGGGTTGQVAGIQTEGQVLGASTLAAAGTAVFDLAVGLYALGGAFSFVGLRLRKTK